MQTACAGAALESRVRHDIQQNGIEARKSLWIISGLRELPEEGQSGVEATS